jgi:hypothetical protein
MLNREIATKYEVKALENVRSNPFPKYDLTPNGPEYRRANYELQRWRERRIDYLKDRLYLASKTMRREFDRER